jgi:hypothetical protein
VRPHETINIYHGQPICLMEFFRNASVPQVPSAKRSRSLSRSRSRSRALSRALYLDFSALALV